MTSTPTATAATPVGKTVTVPVPTVGRKPPTALSPSGTSKFHNCGLSYYLANVAKVPEPTSESACVGTFVHRVLEGLLARPRTERTLEAAAQLARDAWQVTIRGSAALDEPNEDDARQADGDQADFASLGLNETQSREFRWKAWRAIESYFRLEDPAAVKVVAVEQRINGEVAGVPARGIIDRLERDDTGALIVTDYKTGKPPRPGAATYRVSQLATYARLVQAVFEETPKELRLIHLDQNVYDPARERAIDAGAVIVSVPATPSMLAQADRWLNEAWDGIHASMERGAFDATPNRLCDWCTHKPNCPAWGGDVSVALLNAQQPGEVALPFP